MSMIYEEDPWAWWTPTRAMFLASVEQHARQGAKESSRNP